MRRAAGIDKMMASPRAKARHVCHVPLVSDRGNQRVGPSFVLTKHPIGGDEKQRPGLLAQAQCLESPGTGENRQLEAGGFEATRPLVGVLRRTAGKPRETENCLSAGRDTELRATTPRARPARSNDASLLHSAMRQRRASFAPKSEERATADEENEWE